VFRLDEFLDTWGLSFGKIAMIVGMVTLTVSARFSYNRVLKASTALIESDTSCFARLHEKLYYSVKMQKELL
jgi:hypothetical protein